MITINGNPWKQQYQVNNITSTNITLWIRDAQLPDYIGLSTAIVTNTMVYLIGGLTTGNNSINYNYYSIINPDGTLGTWVRSGSPPANIYASQSIITSTRAYILGGMYSLYYPGWPVSDVYYAPINSDGTLGDWVTDTSLIATLGYSQAVVVNNNVYILGGLTYSSGNVPVSNVYSAPINSDGSLGAWVLQSNSLPIPIYASQAVVTNGMVYLLGGLTTGAVALSSIYGAPINSDGSLGTWTLQSLSLPNPTHDAQSLTTSGKAYLFGGIDGTGYATGNVYSISINSDGTFGSLSYELPLFDPLMYSQVVSTGSRIYLIGGYLNFVYTSYLSVTLDIFVDFFKIINNSSTEFNNITFSTSSVTSPFYISSSNTEVQAYATPRINISNNSNCYIDQGNINFIVNNLSNVEIPNTDATSQGNWVANNASVILVDNTEGTSTKNSSKISLKNSSILIGV